MKINHNNIIKKFTNGVNIKIISVEENCSDVTVRNILKKHNIYSTKTTKWSNEEKYIINQYYPIEGVNCYSRISNKTKNNIIDFAKKYKLRVSKSGKSTIYLNRKKKYIINKDLFFKVNHPEESYILGLLWADGCLRNGKDGDNSIRLTLKSEDAVDVKELVFHSGNWSEKTWKHNQNKNLVTKYACCDKVLYDYLVGMGYKNKSYESADRIISSIPEYLRHYWWRGYFDGDGHISICGKCLSITSTHEQNWEFIKYLPTNSKPKVKQYKFKNKNDKINKCSRLCFYGEISKNFLNYIYGGEIFGIKRKYERYKSPVRIFYKSGKRLKNQEQLKMNNKHTSF